MITRSPYLEKKKQTNNNNNIRVCDKTGKKVDDNNKLLERARNGTRSRNARRDDGTAHGTRMNRNGGTAERLDIGRPDRAVGGAPLDVVGDESSRYFRKVRHFAAFSLVRRRRRSTVSTHAGRGIVGTRSEPRDGGGRAGFCRRVVGVRRRAER